MSTTPSFSVVSPGVQKSLGKKKNEVKTYHFLAAEPSPNPKSKSKPKPKHGPRYSHHGLIGSSITGGIGYLLHTKTESDYTRSLGLLMGTSGAFGLAHFGLESAGMYHGEGGAGDNCNRQDELLTIIPTISTFGPMAYLAYQSEFKKTSAFIGVAGTLAVMQLLSGYKSRTCTQTV